MPIQLRASCFYHYYGKCDKPEAECPTCRSYHNIHDVINRGREEEKVKRENRLATRILDFYNGGRK